MANPLLDRAAPEFLASRKQAIDIVEDISTFERLAEIVQKDLASLDEEQAPPDWRAATVRVDLAFGWADSRERLPELAGRVSTRLPAVCQRCLEPCELDLSLDLRVLLLRDDAVAPGDDESLETWELDEEKLRPLDVVEEMLVLALPMAAMHADPADCGVLVEGAEAPRGETVRPFADLKTRIEGTGESGSGDTH